jgi:hypothetical protein
MRSTRRQHVTRWTVTLGALGLLGLLGAVPPAQAAETQGELPLTLTAFAVNRDGYTGAETGTVDITIQQWSTPEEVKRFRDTLVESGDDALLDWLQDQEPVGHIQVDDNLGWDIHFATRDERASGGLRILFVTDRPMSYWELTSGSRSSQYDFIFCEIRLDKNGEGQGKLSGAAQIRYDRQNDRIEMENYTIEPVRLQTVHVVEGGPEVAAEAPKGSMNRKETE